MSNIRCWLKVNFELTAPSMVAVLDNDSYRNTLLSLRESWSNTYPNNGLVLTSEDAYNENGSIIQDSQAFKFKSETTQTEVLAVEWNMSKTGYAVPKVRLRPVLLSGTTVQYCTGYNAKYIKDNNIAVGSVVEIEKHGKIIPTINYAV